MYFPIAGIEISIWIPPVVAFVISFFTSMGGVSGAFLLLPFQVSVLGFTSPSVSTTNQVFNIVAIPGGIYRYIKEGRMVWPLSFIVIIGTLPGVFLGAIIRIQYLPDPKNFKLFAGLVLLYIGFKLIIDLIKPKDQNDNQTQAEDHFQKILKEYKNKDTDPQKKYSKTIIKKFSLINIVYEFYGYTFSINTIGIISLSFIVGIVGGIYGIGGGAIIAPFLVTFFKLPVYTVAGAALMGTFVTSISSVIFYQIIALFYPNMKIIPDWLLGILFGIGGLLGIYCGARLQKFVPAKIIKWILVICIFIPAFEYIFKYFSY